MPKSEDLALWSIATIGSVTLTLRRSGFFFSRLRVFGATIFFALWQRFLASGMTTVSGYSKFYVPARDPSDESAFASGHPGQGRMIGKTVVVTGCTPPDNGISLVTNSPGSIGFFTAVEMFRMGATVIVTTRPGELADTEVVAAIIRESRLRQEMASVYASTNRLRVVHLDLDTDLEDAVNNCVAEIDAFLDETSKNRSSSSRNRDGQIDVLVNNVGAMYPMQSGTDTPPTHPMGLERHVAVNAVAPILLTERLKPKIAENGRIVHVSCQAHTGVRDLNEVKGLLSGRAVSRSAQSYYAASKLVNICYAAQQQKLDPKHIHVAVHPGISLTNLYKNTTGQKFFKDLRMDDWLDGLASLIFKSPKEAAHTPAHCCVDHRVPDQVRKEGALYYVDSKPGNKYLSKLAVDEKSQKECLETVQLLIDNCLGKKRKLAMREMA